MTNFIIPKHVIKKIYEHNDPTSKIIDAMPQPLKNFVTEEFKNLDDCYNHRCHDTRKKVLELQMQIEKLKKDLEKDADDLEDNKRVYALRDKYNYDLLMEEVKKVFESEKNLNVEVKCRCFDRCTSTVNAKKYHMCPPIKAVITQLEKEGYSPTCESQILNATFKGDSNMLHIIKCDLIQ